MAVAPAWLKVLDAIGGLAAVSERFLASRAGTARPDVERPRPSEAAPAEVGSTDALAGLGQIETRLAGVVVAALKEAFDRDRARLDLERHHLDAEREQADRALRLERRRLAGDRMLTELRLIAILAVAVWIVSAAFMIWRGAEPDALRSLLVAGGWGCLVGAVGCGLTAHGRLQAWLASDDPDEPTGRPLVLASVASWLLVTGFALTAGSVLAAL